MDFYYFSICNLCKQQSASLKKCSKCKMVFYCSREHQLEDWFMHRDLCKAITETSRFLVLPPDSNCDDFNKFKRTNGVLWEYPMDRSLTISEHHMWMFPKVCTVCFSSEVTMTCGGCHSVGYCSEKHQDTDKEKHGKFCHELKVGLEISQKLYKHQFLPKWDKFHIQKEPLRLPDNIEEVVKVMKLDLDVERDIMHNPLNFKIFTHVISLCVSIVYGLEKSGFIVDRHAKKTELVIHLQATMSCINKSLLYFLKFLSHWIQNLTDVEIYQFNTDIDLITCMKSVSSCSSCRLGKCEATLKNFHGEYNCEMTGTTPDVVAVILTNEHADTQVKHVSRFFAYKKVPVMFLSQSLEALQQHFQRLPQANVNVLVQPGENPYRSLRPERNFVEGEDPVVYANKFISVVCRK